jgi:putative ABC transport system permease protein
MLFTYLREAIHHLYSAKQRTLIALVGISIGISAVIAMVSIGMIFGQETTRQFAGMGIDIMVISKNFWEPDNKNTPITLKEALELPQLVPGIATVAPIISYHGEYRFAGYPKPGDQEDRYLRLLGVTASFQELNKLQLQEGRFISDLDEKQSYVVLGCKVRTYPGFKTFKGKLVGKLIKINNYYYLIIGVLKCTPAESSLDSLGRYYDIDTAVFLPISTIQYHYHSGRGIEELMVRMQPKVNYLLLSTLVKQYFAKRVKGLKVQVGTAKGLIKQSEKTAQRITFLLAAIGSISLLAGCIGIMNVMLTAVIERRREIGILRAIGAKRRDIRWQFLTEAVILSLIGGAFGTGLGITAAYCVAWFNEWQFLISYQVILLGVGVSSAVGIFFGFYPAHKAAKLDPITALRSE